MKNDSPVFIDSNVLIYAADDRPEEAAKASLARSVLAFGEIAISYQVLQEFYACAVHPRKLGYSREKAAKICETWMRFHIEPLGAHSFARAIRFAIRYQISNWDGAILAAAEQAGCSTVYSEDLNDGQNYDGIRVINPFK